jgi:hypothetical protein
VNIQPSSVAAPICRKEICWGFPKTSWSSLSPPSSYTNRSKRTKRNRQGPPVSIEWIHLRGKEQLATLMTAFEESCRDSGHVVWTDSDPKPPWLAINETGECVDAVVEVKKAPASPGSCRCWLRGSCATLSSSALVGRRRSANLTQP